MNWAAALDWVFPRICAICESAAEGAALCGACAPGLEWVRPPYCPLCGAGPAGRECGECAGRSVTFAGALALGRYEGRYRDLVLKMKFRGGRVLADELGRRLAGRLEVRPDLVVPVPMGTWKLLLRGYNAAELLARRLAHHAGLPCASRVLRKVRRTRAQAGLDLARRLENPRGAYRARRVKGRVLLVDDVLTTGATASACASALLEAGASEVFVAAAARATLHSGG